MASYGFWKALTQLPEITFSLLRSSVQIICTLGNELQNQKVYNPNPYHLGNINKKEKRGKKSG